MRLRCYLNSHFFIRSCRSGIGMVEELIYMKRDTKKVAHTAAQYPPRGGFLSEIEARLTE